MTTTSARGTPTVVERAAQPYAAIRRQVTMAQMGEVLPPPLSGSRFVRKCRPAASWNLRQRANHAPAEGWSRGSVESTSPSMIHRLGGVSTSSRPPLGRAAASA